MTKRSAVLFAASLLLLLFTQAQAQAQDGAVPKTPPTPAQIYLENWNNIGRKLTAMAAEFPEDKYDYRPSPEVRTFAEQLLHVVSSNMYVAKTARGEKVEFPDLKRADYTTKASIVDAMKQSVADGAAAIKDNSDDQVRKRTGLLVGFLEHSGEHYGQLVVYYRLNGIVPPESRPKK